jgi:hypothetical protein
MAMFLHQQVQDVRTPPPSGLSGRTFPESVKDGLTGAGGTNRTVRGKSPIDTSTPLIHSRGAVPDEPKKACLFFDSVVTPHRGPMEFEIIHEDPAPFLNNRINDDVPASEEVPPHLGSVLKKWNWSLGDRTLVATVVLSTSAIVLRRGLLGPAEFSRVPRESLSLAVADQDGSFLGALSDFGDPNPAESTKNQRARNFVGPTGFGQLSHDQATRQRLNSKHFSAQRNLPGLGGQASNQLRIVASQQHELGKTIIGFEKETKPLLGIDGGFGPSQQASPDR